MSYEEMMRQWQEQINANPTNPDSIVDYMNMQMRFLENPTDEGATALDRAGSPLNNTPGLGTRDTQSQQELNNLRHLMNNEQEVPFTFNEGKEKLRIAVDQLHNNTAQEKFIQDYVKNKTAKIQEEYENHKSFMNAIGGKPLLMYQFAEHQGMLNADDLQSKLQAHLEQRKNKFNLHRYILRDKHTLPHLDFNKTDDFELVNNMFRPNTHRNSPNNFSDALDRVSAYDTINIPSPGMVKYLLKHHHPEVNSDDFESILPIVNETSEGVPHGSLKSALEDFMIDNFSAEMVADNRKEWDEARKHTLRSFEYDDDVYKSFNDTLALFENGHIQGIAKNILEHDNGEWKGLPQEEPHIPSASQNKGPVYALNAIHRFFDVISNGLEPNNRYNFMAHKRGWLKPIFYRHLADELNKKGDNIHDGYDSEMFDGPSQPYSGEDYTDLHAMNKENLNEDFTLAKSDIQEFDPENDKLSSLRVIPTYNLPTFDMPQMVSYGGEGAGLANAFFEDKIDSINGKSLPGVVEGEPVAGTWVMPASRRALTRPDVSFPLHEHTSLLGITNPDLDWWRTPEEGATATEGFQYEGFDPDDFRHIPLLDKTSLFDIRYGASGKPRQHGGAPIQQERRQKVHDILSEMNLPFKLRDDTAAWHQDLTRFPVTENLTGRKSEPMEVAMRLLKGEFGPTDEEIPSLEDFESWYNQHYKTTPQQAYGSGDVEEHLGLYDQSYYNPLSMDKRITEATKDALPEVVRNYPNLSQFDQAPIFIEQDEGNALGRHLKNNSGMGIVNLLAADAHKVADEPYQEMKRTMQHELGHGIIDNALAGYDAHEEMGSDIPQPLRNIADWHDDDEEGLVEELPHSIYDKDLDRSRWNTVNQYYKETGEPMDIAMRLLKAPVYDTDIPGIQFVTQGKGEDWTQDENLHGGLPGLWMKEGKAFSPSERAIPLDPSMADSRNINEIEQMTPNHFLEAAGKESMDDGEHYKTLMERAMGGEDMRFVMPRLSEFFPDSPPGHDGRHRMLALRNLGHGDTPVPVSVSEEHIPVQTGEPMDIAMRLLKLELVPPMTQGVEETPPIQEDIPTVDIDTMGGGDDDCCEKVREWLLSKVRPNAEGYHEIMNASCEEIKSGQIGETKFLYDKIAELLGCSEGFDSDFQNIHTGEPMEIAMRLLKDFYFDEDEPFTAGTYMPPFFVTTPDGENKPGLVPIAPKYDVDDPEYHHFRHYSYGNSDPNIRYRAYNTASKIDEEDMPLHALDNNYDFPTFAGANLSAHGHLLDEHEDEDKSIRDIGRTLAHEYVHEATEDEINRAILDGFLPKENETTAKEIAAFNLQYPGGQEEADKAQMALRAHHDVPDDMVNPRAFIAKNEPMDIAMRLLKDFYIGKPDRELGSFITSNKARPGQSIMRYMKPNTVDRKEPSKEGDFQRGNSLPRYITKPSYDTNEKVRAHFVGTNLANLGDENDPLPNLFQTDAHENIHRLIDFDIQEAIDRGELPAENRKIAHETGAYAGHTAHEDNGSYDNDKTSFQYHPDVPEGYTLPKPFFNATPTYNQSEVTASPVPDMSFVNGTLTPNHMFDVTKPQQKLTGEPMEVAMRLLKALPQDQVIPRIEHLKGRENIPKEESQDRQTGHPAALGMARRQALKRPLGETRLYVTNNHQWDEDEKGNYYQDDMEGNRVQRIQPGSPQEELGDPMKSEQYNGVLVKERISPEAKQHKLDYDKQYESNPIRVKYREGLNQERRKRGIYGSHNHKDISHTEGGKLTLENEHENRARHFKGKGTLRQVHVKKSVQQTLPSYSHEMVSELQGRGQKTMYIASKPNSNEEGLTDEELDERHNDLLREISELNANHDFTIFTGKGMSPWGGEHTVVLQNVPNELDGTIHAIANRYGQEAIGQSDEGEEGAHFLNPSTGEVGDTFSGQEFQENPEFYTKFPTKQKLTFTE